MDYEVMLDFHKAHNADVGIAVMPVPQEEGQPFVVVTDRTDYGVSGKAGSSKRLTSIGIYIFT